MSMDSSSFFNNSDFSFVKEKPNIEEKKYKNMIDIYLFNKTILQNSYLDGFFKIIIPENLENGSFYLKLISEEKNIFDLKAYKNNSHLEKIQNYMKENNIKNYISDEKGILKTNYKSKITPEKNFENKKKKLDNSHIFDNQNSKIRLIKNNKIQPLKNKIRSKIDVENLFTNKEIPNNTFKLLEKEKKFFTINEEIKNKSLLILPFSLFISDEYYPSINLNFSIIEEDYFNIINKFQNSKEESTYSENSIILNSNKISINLKYKIQIYYLSEKAFIDTKNLSKSEKSKKFEDLKNSNNYFESNISFTILPNWNELKDICEKKLTFKKQIKIINYKLLCLKFRKKFDIKIDFNKNFLNDNELNLTIFFNYENKLLKYFKYWDIVIFSKFKNKSGKLFDDNILYLNSNLLKNDKNTKIQQFIKIIKLKDISNKVQCFETFELSNNFFILFYWSKDSFNFDKLVDELPLYYYKYVFKYNIKTNKQIINYYKDLEIKMKNFNDAFILPYCSINKDLK